MPLTGMTRLAAKFRPSFLERRRKHLSFWLATILLHSEMGGSGVVRAWILED